MMIYPITSDTNMDHLIQEYLPVFSIVKLLFFSSISFEQILRGLCKYPFIHQISTA